MTIEKQGRQQTLTVCLFIEAYKSTLPYEPPSRVFLVKLSTSYRHFAIALHSAIQGGRRTLAVLAMPQLL